MGKTHLSNQSAVMEAQIVVYIRRIDGDFEIQAEHIVDSFHIEVFYMERDRAKSKI